MMRIAVHQEDYALTKLHADAAVGISSGGRFCMVSRLGGETMLVCESRFAPEGDVQAGYRLVEILENFALDSVGVVAAITAPLASAGISLFAFSAWNTDVLLVRDTDIERTACALAEAGHAVVRA